jgi:predicted amino acid dehydrogenase
MSCRLRNGKDVIVVEGGVLHTNSINCHFNFGLRHKNDIFSCLAEVLLLVYQKNSGHKSIKEMDLNLLEEFEVSAGELGFRICPQNILGEIKLN